MPFVFLLAAFTGCAHISHQDPQTGLEVTYTGPAGGAVALVHAADPRPYNLAEDALNKGMSTSVRITSDGNVAVNAGYGYSGYYPGSVGGYAPGNTGYIPGQGFVTGPPVSTLTPLDTTTVVTGTPQSQATDGIVPCPTDRPPQSTAEQAACAWLTAKTALEQSNK